MSDILMYYSGHDGTNYRIGYATSANGESWTRQGQVLGLGAGGQWDDANVLTGTVIKESETSYKMWYSGYDGSNYRIGYATSTDGSNWTRQGQVLDIGAGGQWDDTHLYDPFVIKVSETSYMMYYTGNDGSVRKIGLATSTDGSNWTRQGQVLGLGAGGQWDDAQVRAPSVVIDAPNLYKMWYSGYDGSNYRIGYATSTDGSNWTRQGQVLDLGTSGQWDDAGVLYAYIYSNMTSSSYKMWYTGYSGSNYRIGLATSTDGENWIKQGQVLDLGTSGQWDDNHVRTPSIIYPAPSNSIFKAWIPLLDNRGAVFKSRNAFGTNAIFKAQVSQGIQGILISNNEISDKITGIFKSNTILSGTPISGIFKSRTVTSEKDSIQGIFKSVTQMSEDVPVIGVTPDVDPAITNFINSGTGLCDVNQFELFERGAVQDNWIINFTSATNFTMTGTTTGLVGSGNVSSNFTPINSTTGQPYINIPSGAWSGTFTVNDDINFTTSNFQTIAWDITLDGLSIKRHIISLNVSYKQDNVHNTINLSSTSQSLYEKIDTTDNWGESRLTFTIGDRILNFLLEDKQGSNNNFSIWGRSLSAQNDAPYITDIDYILTDAEMVSVLADDLITGLDWQTSDWLIPNTFEFSGTPIKGVNDLANEINAITRCNDAGTTFVRAAYPTRPYKYNTQTPIAIYTRESNIIDISYSVALGTGKDAIMVQGEPAEIYAPMIEVEAAEGTREIGSDSVVRVYWADRTPIVVEQDSFVSDGNIRYISDTRELIKEEVVTFVNGVGNTSKPVFDLLGWEWIGLSGEDLASTKHTTQLTISDNAYRVAKITYDIYYGKYLCTNHSVVTLIGYISYITKEQVAVICRLNGGINEESVLVKPLLTNTAVCAISGIVYFDKYFYDKKIVQIVVPYHPDVKDGEIISISDTKLNIVGNFHILSCDINIAGPRITNTIEAEQIC